MFQKYLITADCREKFDNEVNGASLNIYNDHPSQNSIDQIVYELNKEGYKVSYFGGVDALIDAYNKHQQFPNSLFLNFSDGLTQKSRKAQSAILLEMLNVEYAGSSALSMLIANNKYYAKKIVSEKILVADGILLFSSDEIPDNLKYPIVIKPNDEGSSIGITQESICHNSMEFYQRLPKWFNKFNVVIVEEYIPGYELTCFLIGNKGNYSLSEVILCEYNGFTYFDDFVFGITEKASHTRQEHLAEHYLPQKQINNIINTAKNAFELLGMCDFARIDFRLDKSGKLTFIEINGNPVISQTSEIGIISNERNISFGKLVEKIIITAEKRISSRD